MLNTYCFSLGKCISNIQFSIGGNTVGWSCLDTTDINWWTLILCHGMKTSSANLMHKFTATSNSKSVVLTNCLLLGIKIYTSSSSSNICRIDHFDSTFILPINDKMWKIASPRHWEKALKPSLWWANPRIFFNLCEVLDFEFKLYFWIVALKGNLGKPEIVVIIIFLTVKFRSNYCTSLGIYFPVLYIGCKE